MATAQPIGRNLPPGFPNRPLQNSISVVLRTQAFHVSRINCLPADKMCHTCPLEEWLREPMMFAGRVWIIDCEQKGELCRPVQES